MDEHSLSSGLSVRPASTFYGEKVVGFKPHLYACFHFQNLKEVH